MATSTASGLMPSRVCSTSVLNMQRLTMSRVTRIISPWMSTTSPLRWLRAMCATCAAVDADIDSYMRAMACLV